MEYDEEACMLLEKPNNMVILNCLPLSFDKITIAKESSKIPAFIVPYCWRVYTLYQSWNNPFSLFIKVSLCQVF